MAGLRGPGRDPVNNEYPPSSKTGGIFMYSGRGGVRRMTVLEAIRERRSVRSYIDKPVEPEKIDQLMEAARLAPSAGNRQEWRFVVVNDPDTRRRLSLAANQGFVAEAGCVIAACADTDNYRMRCGQLSYPIDVAISIDHITLRAVELGLGTCWIGAFSEKEVKSILQIPDEITVVELLTVGYGAGGAASRKKRLSREKIFFHERWGQHR
jgi:nitroreductase